MYTTILELSTRFALATGDKEFDPDTVTPGIWGFVATAVIALAVVGIGFDMVRRIRRTNYKAEISARLEAELAEREAGATGATDGGTAASAPDDK
ncbi:hypothetical protein [Microterricola viridarii]|uniref:Uncharacterized protein n=1 Tax=Microterricola viridarii TaxID=412690 RepID=A0A1H1XLN6_9MICO|nr:hypothetical protein [Microterricola viridarii]SDT10225.1 hypothetical protein SAMN04489834_2829 [Microterricola viridarii]